MTRFISGILVIAAAAAVAILANLALLAYASSSNDTVGKLAPTASLPGSQPSTRPSLPAAPPRVIRPQTGPYDERGADD
jgi:hypothetical protein